MAFYEILKKQVPGYLGLHHRLDQDTSGLMLFSRDRSLNKDISRAFQHRLVTKEYLAVASGSWPVNGDRLVIEDPIGRHTGPRGTRYVVARSGKKARTEVRLLAEADGILLLGVYPRTGRTHQIRVHLAHRGMPLTGDALYGGIADTCFLLHCFRLSWPDVGQLSRGAYSAAVPVNWFASLPKNLGNFLTRLTPGEPEPCGTGDDPC